MDELQQGNSDDGGRGEDAQIDEFIHQLTESQSNLRAYLLAALGNYDDASEVLQRTNLVLWRNARTFHRGAEFMPWAVALARFEIKSFYRDRSRDRFVFSEEVAELMLQTVAAKVPDVNERKLALKECLEQLSGASRDMIRLRYEDRASFRQMSEDLGRTEGAIRTALARIRKSLAGCISKRMQVGV